MHDFSDSEPVLTDETGKLQKSAEAGMGRTERWGVGGRDVARLMQGLSSIIISVLYCLPFGFSDGDQISLVTHATRCLAVPEALWRTEFTEIGYPAMVWRSFFQNDRQVPSSSIIFSFSATPMIRGTRLQVMTRVTRRRPIAVMELERLLTRLEGHHVDSSCSKTVQLARMLRKLIWSMPGSQTTARLHSLSAGMELKQ